HERGLIHRDMKPSNIFVMDDDSVKIIDFGIAYSEAAASTGGMKGTLPYMAPELLQMKPPSAVTDVFAIGAVCYEALTLRRAFEGANDAEISNAVLYRNPPPASEISKNVSQTVGRAVHKAFAKQPWHRYTSAREFSEILTKALRNEPIEYFDPAKVLPRVERASKAFERGEHHVASEMLGELEGEGHIDQEITHLRRRIEQATRQIGIRQMLDSARRFFEEEEYSLSLRKIQEALQLDPNDANAQSLKNQVEGKRREKKMGEWSQLARRHLDNNAFSYARSAIQSLLDLKANDTDALEMLAEIGRREQEYERVRHQKSALYDNAVEAWQRGDVTAALSRLERWVLLDRGAPDTNGERLLSSQNFYNQVRSEHEAIKNSYDEARAKLTDGNFAAALGLCEQYLAKYPGHALFQALKFDVSERQRQNFSAFVAETDRLVESEPDLGKRCNLLDAALKVYPREPHFERAFKLARDKRDLVNSVIGKAQLHEEQNRFSEALDQWEMLRAIHGQYPGLDYEIDRLKQRRDTQARSDAKADWVKQVDRYLESRDYTRALEAAQKGLVEFPHDTELTELEKLTRQKVERATEAMRLLAIGGGECAEGRFDEGLETMRRAYRLDEGNTVVRTVLADKLGARARVLFEKDTGGADRLISEILDLDPNHSLGRNLRAMALDKKREEFVSWCTGQARRLQGSGDLEGARAVVQQGLVSYPQEPRLSQLLATLLR
ncbi:MAG: protein kinase, partial [Bryobacteraceae bacterium]